MTAAGDDTRYATFEDAEGDGYWVRWTHAHDWHWGIGDTIHEDGFGTELDAGIAALDHFTDCERAR